MMIMHIAYSFTNCINNKEIKDDNYTIENEFKEEDEYEICNHTIYYNYRY